MKGFIIRGIIFTDVIVVYINTSTLQFYYFAESILAASVMTASEKYIAQHSSTYRYGTVPHVLI